MICFQEQVTSKVSFVSKGSNTMKKIISSKSALILCLFAIISFFSFSMIVLGLVLFGEAEEKVTGLLFFCVCFGFSCFLLWYLNRAACVVWVEDSIIKCKGVICGFYKECPVHSIQSVKIQYSAHEIGFGTFLYLVDDRTKDFKKFLRIRKDSYICFRKTKKNLAFLQTFWFGAIEK